jgi:hypothetical protein
MAVAVVVEAVAVPVPVLDPVPVVALEPDPEKNDWEAVLPAQPASAMGRKSDKRAKRIRMGSFLGEENC